jgi:hypothetical protein
LHLGNIKSQKSDRAFWSLDQAAKMMPNEVCATTDDRGRFEFSSAPADVIVWVLMKHPQYADMTLFTTTGENPPETDDKGYPLVKLPLQLTLQSVRTITVHVRSKQDDKPLAGILIRADQQRASGYSAMGTSDKEGNATPKLPPGKYQIVADPPLKSDYLRTIEDISVEKTPAKQSVTLRQQEGCVLILKAIDLETGNGVAMAAFSYSFQKDGQRVGARVQSGTSVVNHLKTNEKGELRAVVEPGTRLYNVDSVPDGYECEDVGDWNGRELELTAGKTITETFKFRKKK